MGITRETSRHRKRREMYLLLFFLISPAFGKPSNAPGDVEAEAAKHFSTLNKFNNETRSILNNTNLFDVVAQNLQEAEKKILEMNANLKLLETDEVKFEGKYFPTFNDAKSSLRQTRQSLRKLADRTVNDVEDMKIHLEALDKTDDPMELQFAMDRMKDLMVETLERLKEAEQKYNEALVSFENLNDSIKVHNIKLTKMVTKGTAEYEAWVEKCRGGVYGAAGGTTLTCIIADSLGALGICSAISAAGVGIAIAITEVKINEYTRTLEKMKKITDRMLQSGEEFDKSINEAIKNLSHEIDLIGQWSEAADNVSQNIQRYPATYLKKYKTLQRTFTNGINRLGNAAENFLAQPVDILD